MKMIRMLALDIFFVSIAARWAGMSLAALQAVPAQTISNDSVQQVLNRVLFKTRNADLSYEDCRGEC